MKKYIILLLIPLFILSSCMKDTSAYLPQTKKEVKVDPITPDGTNPEIPAGSLSPGIHQVKLNVTYNGTQSERRFKYFMPVSIDKSKQISLIFNFHGSYNTGVDPLEGVSMSNPISQLAIKENCIIVFPAGEDTGSAVNWQNTDYHLPFVDSMVTYFKTHTPVADENRIYTCGHSSGAIFSFALAFYRSNIFAAAVPVSGQMKLTTSEVPPRAVPIRAFNGKDDNTVLYSAALDNINTWATTVGGYFASDAIQSDTLKIDNYKQYLTKVWRGANADIEFFTIVGEGHGINWYYIMPLMWNFMNTHPKGVVSSSLYVTSEYKSIDAMEGQTFNSAIKCTDGATVTLVSSPSDWNVSYSNKVLTVKAPDDFFAPTTLNRKGEIRIKAELNGASVTISIPFTLKAPKTYFEVGDLVYDSNYKPTGIVFWVNPANVKEAKIIALEHVTRKFGPVGSTFFTPSFEDGYGNTLALVERVRQANLTLNASTSAFIYAYEYKASPGNTIGWYLPAVDELKALDANLATVNAALLAYGTPLPITSSASSYHLSSTSINGGTPTSPNKKFYTFDYHSNPSYHGYYILTHKADDTAYVSTRPIKKVTK
ncbi:MAG: PHB depolymerase family esterase [Bacteroidales bacterium]